MAEIRILADDLTGALDTAAVFRGQIPVFIDRPSPKEAVHPVSVIAIPTRDVSPAILPEYLVPVLPWFESATMVFKKVDSLIRGNTFSEVVWLFRNGKFDKIIFAPAFPRQGRVTVQGQHYLVSPENGNSLVPLLENLQQLFQQHGLSSALGAQERDADVLIPDILSENDLARTVQRYAEEPGTLWCGSAALAQALAAHFEMASEQKEPVRLLEANPILLITASHHAVLRNQWRHLCETCEDRIVVGNARTLALSIDRICQGAEMVCLYLSPDENLNSPVLASELLTGQLEQLLMEIPKPKQLIVIGGDTLMAVCRVSGTNMLLAQSAGRNGWGFALLTGGRWSGVPCYSRSGAFGMPDDLVNMLHWINHGAVVD